MARKRKSNISNIISFAFENAKLIIVLVVGGAFWFFRKKDEKKQSFSDNERVSNAIGIIDACVNHLGTFDFHLEPIFGVLEKLTAIEIKKLHKDFGLRYYHSLLGIYSLVSFLEGYSIARPLNLSGIFYKEFDDEQIERLKKIYKSKGVDFLL